MKYEDLDRMLVEEILAGRNRVEVLVKDSSPVKVVAMSYRKKDPWRGFTPVTKIIEMRLQALRKQGWIRWTGQVWEVSDPQA